MVKDNMKRLKDYSIKTKIIIEEHRAKYTNGKGSYEQPFICYSYIIDYGYRKIMCGGIKTKEDLINSLAKEVGNN